MNVQEVLYKELSKRDDMSIPLTTEEKWTAIRNYRNSLLNYSDWVICTSFDRDKIIPTEWSTYRQLLRDIPETYSTPEDVIFPVSPNLNNSDLFENNPPLGSSAWGSIVGTLSTQTDLQSALDGKAPSLGADDNYVTDAEKTKLANLSGTNTGDQTLPTDATIVTSDVTTNNVSVSKHGWMSKLPGGTTTYYRADGTWATPSGGGSSYTLVATLAGDQATGANTTPVNLTGLVWTYQANSTYFFRWVGEVLPAATTTGCGFQLDVSTASVTINMGFTHQLANTGTLSGGSSRSDNVSLGVSTGMASITVPTVVVGHGMIRTGAVTGTAQLRFRSEVAAITTAKAGMTLVVEKVV